ncbi:response regulator transcription factor CtrA [Candidatus Sneabacter namystus]|uniref:Response regulator transcription factor n=1 Tax=Candidatus Sneabacter namystus TaxID=2601646 RepID=A0A5C0UH33_9RICK|nr:response regulator transcription factor [Candidatus Sneabacter namystus]QEK39408.1 response regulator transcription factor [Candidatus Sneabacter namystus]
MESKVLLIEDDPITARSVELILTSHNMICDTAHIGTEGLEIAKIHDYDLIILDLVLPDVDGYEVLLRLRAAKVQAPVLILSGLTSPEKKIRGFSIGADDYLTKPFDKEELVARIKAIIRRSKGLSDSTIRFDKVVINLDAKSVEVEGKPLKLTNSEYTILHLLALRKGTVVSKEMFLNHLYRGREEPDVKIIDVFVCKLRKKLSDASGGVNYIETVWGRGHMLKDIEPCDTNN